MDSRLVILLYMIVPGFVADTFFRSIRGMEKGGEMERVLRSLVWSVFGLSTYLLLIGSLPEYLHDVTIADKTPAFSRINLVQLAAHSFFAAAISGSAAALVEARWVRTLLQSVFSRSLAERAPWDVMWVDHRYGRLVQVQRKDGPTYVGYLLAASTGSADREIVLRDPGVVEVGQQPKPIEHARLLYIAGSEIAEIRLSPTQEEVNAAESKG